MALVKVKLLVSRAGESFSNIAGDVVEVEAAEAKRMFEAEQAEPVAQARAKKSTRAVAADDSEKR